MIDPSTIDLKMALEMTYGRYGEPLSLKCDKFPDVIDFDELEKIKPPRGYRIKVYSRDLKIEISSFRGICPGAVHYYCKIRFNGPDLVRKSDNSTGFGAGWPKKGRIFGLQSMDVNRPLMEEDLADKSVDWEFYKVGDMTHRWYDIPNAIACARKIIELRFRNYGEIEVEDYYAN